MMDGADDFALADASAPVLEPFMARAIACLGGDKTWAGEARVFGGLLTRSFAIQSRGAVANGVLAFDETLVFDNGERQDRQWRITPSPGGLLIASDDVETISPGRIESDGLVFEYTVRLGSMAYSYRDMFVERADGSIENRGVAKKFGLPIMTIFALGRPG